MNLEKMVIHYDGFTPTVLTQYDTETVIEEILTEAPIGASVEATFTRKDEIIKGFVHVHSSAGPFFAIVTGSEIDDVSHKLLLSMRRRFNKWRAKRFSLSGFANTFEGQRQLT